MVIEHVSLAFSNCIAVRPFAWCSLTSVQVEPLSFEISRRHRFHRDLATLPSGIAVHVLPTGGNPNAKYNDIAKLRYNHRHSIAASMFHGFLMGAFHGNPSFSIGTFGGFLDLRTAVVIKGRPECALVVMGMQDNTHPTATDHAHDLVRSQAAEHRRVVGRRKEI